MSTLTGRFRLTRPFIQNLVMGWCVLAPKLSSSKLLADLLFHSILFCLPGIYIALTGLGAGGGRASSQETAALTNSYVATWDYDENIIQANYLLESFMVFIHLLGGVRDRSSTLSDLNGPC